MHVYKMIQLRVTAVYGIPGQSAWESVISLNLIDTHIIELLWLIFCKYQCIVNFLYYLM